MAAQVTAWAFDGAGDSGCCLDPPSMPDLADGLPADINDPRERAGQSGGLTEIRACHCRRRVSEFSYPDVVIGW